MKRMKIIVLITTLLSITPAAPADEAIPGKNALLIQADFAGLVMTGVAYSVSKGSRRLQCPPADSPL